MTPAEAQKMIESVRVKRPSQVRLRVVGSIDNPQSDGPGATLQNARREMGLSVVQIAQALKLRPEHIAAMESMNFAKLPGLGFALGYVRAYAELVDIQDINALVADFKEAWAPKQKHLESVRSKQFDTRLVLPFGFAIIGALVIWMIIGAITNGLFAANKNDEITSPDAAITEWANKPTEQLGKSVVVIDPLVSIKALRNVRVTLRGQDGALVADKSLKAGETLPADGLGRFIISTPDAGALEIRGYGLTIGVGDNHQAVDFWRVPDLAAMAKQKADEEAAEALAKTEAEAKKAGAIEAQTR